MEILISKFFYKYFFFFEKKKFIYLISNLVPFFYLILFPNNHNIGIKMGFLILKKVKKSNTKIKFIYFPQYSKSNHWHDGPFSDL